MSNNRDNGTEQNCCGACRNPGGQRPSFVVGVFAEAEMAKGAAERVRCGTGCPEVNVVSGSKSGNGRDLNGFRGLGCGHLYDQISHHLQSGALLVVVDVETPEQQRGISRVLLESKCDLLLTHDGSRRVD